MIHTNRFWNENIITFSLHNYNSNICELSPREIIQFSYFCSTMFRNLEYRLIEVVVRIVT